jgi:hypothetical protein
MWKTSAAVIRAGYEDKIERMFDCEPLDDQLRAYVETDSTDTTVLNVYISGE